jgi:hypothetical protein
MLHERLPLTSRLNHSQPSTARKCAAFSGSSSDAPNTYDCAYDAPAHAAGKFRLARNSTTNTIKGLADGQALFLW